VEKETLKVGKKSSGNQKKKKGVRCGDRKFLLGEAFSWEEDP